MSKKRVGFEKNVFINCPFDNQYIPLFRSIVFAIHDAGFRPRCALEVFDAGEVRLLKIIKIISECKYSIHDLSRTELDKVHSLPRFNMPLELGIDFGCKSFGGSRHKNKRFLIMEKKQYGYQKYISDIAGLDVMSHSNKPRQAIINIRKWLRTVSGRTNIPGASIIYDRYRKFTRELPRRLAKNNLNLSDLTFVDFSYFIAFWLKANPL